jgi:hypothetical protein
MWFKVEHARTSVGQKFVVRCNAEVAGSRIVEERPAKGVNAARKTAELLASTLNVTTTVYGSDAEGEFVYGVYEVAEGAASANSPVIKQLFAESAAASLTFKDQLLASIPEDTIKGLPPCRRRWATWWRSTSRSNARQRRKSATRRYFAFSASPAIRARCRCRRTTPP